MSSNIPDEPMNQTPRTWLGTVFALVGAALSTLFLANLGLGLGFEIPDILPVIGNVDEVVASAVLFSCLSYLGVNVLPHWMHPSVITAAKQRTDAR
jgi:hypothetical protein